MDNLIPQGRWIKRQYQYLAIFKTMAVWWPRSCCKRHNHLQLIISTCICTVGSSPKTRLCIVPKTRKGGAFSSSTQANTLYCKSPPPLVQGRLGEKKLRSERGSRRTLDMGVGCLRSQKPKEKLRPGHPDVRSIQQSGPSWRLAQVDVRPKSPPPSSSSPPQPFSSLLMFNEWGSL